MDDFTDDFTEDFSDDFFLFHKSVTGHLHHIKDLPCQDSSFSYQDEFCHIAIVADGHGDPACCRSDIGSKLIVDITATQLKSFAYSLTEENTPQILQDLLRPKSQKKILRTLTDSIIAKWYQEIESHLSQHSLTEKELQQSGNYTALYAEGKRLPHIFGTTLIAALWLKDFLILIQQGDGQCNLFLENNTLSQPIPTDPRCHENVTTSLCDTDVPSAIRTHVIHLKETPVTACLLGTDGVEDSYPDLTGNFIFYKELLLQFSKDNFQNPDPYLSDYLPLFSENGSGDDISVAGILKPSTLSFLTPNYQEEITLYYLEIQLKHYNDKINSMARKHDILTARWEKVSKKVGNVSDTILLDEYLDTESEYIAYHEEYTSYQEKSKELQAQLEELKQKGGQPCQS